MMRMIQATFYDGTKITRKTDRAYAYGWRVRRRDGTYVASGFAKPMRLLPKDVYLALLHDDGHRLEMVTVDEIPDDNPWRIQRSFDQGKTWKYCRLRGKAHSRYPTQADAEKDAALQRIKSNAIYRVISC